jgi:hypothetical protein
MRSGGLERWADFTSGIWGYGGGWGRVVCNVPEPSGMTWKRAGIQICNCRPLVF